MKRIILICLFLFSSLIVSAQYTLGTTGLLSTPSADMQREGTFMMGGGFLHDKITPVFFNYNTYNYFLNVTIFPFLEVAYNCTMYKATDTFVPEKKGRYVNQDRAFTIRLRLLREREYLPAVVIGGNDIYTQVKKGNAFYKQYYIALGKHLEVKSVGRFGANLSYFYNDLNKISLKNICGGFTYEPLFVKNLKLIGEFTSDYHAIGAKYLLFNHVDFQVLLQNGKYMSGGLAYKIYFKK